MWSLSNIYEFKCFYSPSLKLNPHVLQILDIGINNPSLFPLKIVVQLSIGFLHFGHFIECKRSFWQRLDIANNIEIFEENVWKIIVHALQTNSNLEFSYSGRWNTETTTEKCILIRL